MAYVRIAWPQMPWIAGSDPRERKKSEAGHGVTMLEFAPGFVDPQWCDRGHVLLVLDGTLELELESGTERLAAGEAAVVDAGTRHRAANPTSAPARIFVVARPEPVRQ
jgi:quercetin dioxygenase-like cupin family protein